MKNLYHLFVARFKRFTSHLLPHTSYLKRFTSNLKPLTSYLKRFTSHLLPHTSYLIPLFFFLPFAAFAQNEATVTDVVFSCPGTITVTYDLDICSLPADVTLKYSPDKQEWFTATTENGVRQGNGKTITWNVTGDASFGKFYYKVEYSFPPPPPTCVQLNGVMVNGTCWAQYNLNESGKISENHESSSYGWNVALYQWGRFADGHQDHNSTTTTTLSPTDDPGHNKFILTSNPPDDWHAAPRNDFLWNSGTEACPIKTDYDPCPEHWRVPTRTELNGLMSTAINASGPVEIYPGTVVVGRWFGDGGVPSLYLPTCGERRYDDGVINAVGGWAAYWSSTPTNSGSSYRFQFTSGLVHIGSLQRAYGFSVRCVAEF